MEGVVLMIHGIGESPAGMRALAEMYHDAGYNVVAITLRGHGSNKWDLRRATLEDWQADVDEGRKIAKNLGNKVVVEGYSIGGALAVDAASRHPEIVKGLNLHAPTLDVHPRLKTSLEAKLKKWETDNHLAAAWFDGKPAEPGSDGVMDFGYDQVHIHAFKEWKKLFDTQGTPDLKIPVSFTRSEKDLVVDGDRIKKMLNAQKIKFPLQEIVHTRDQQVTHTGIVRPTEKHGRIHSDGQLLMDQIFHFRNQIGIH